VHTLLRIAKKHGVEIAIENVPEPYPFLMKSAHDFSRFYNELDEDLGLVFDIGHAHINRQTEDFIARFSDKIVHIHASDNDGAGDQHLGIGYGTIDWNGVAKALEKVKYNGLIILESVEHVEESLKKLQKLFT